MPYKDREKQLEWCRNYHLKNKDYHREYYKNHYLQNKDQVDVRNKKWQEDNPEKYKDSQRRAQLLGKFGLTVEDYEKMLEAQNGLCAICGNEETVILKGKVKKLSVDHCHNTNKVRKLLCHRCNIGLGSFRDNPEALREAASYIEEFA